MAQKRMFSLSVVDTDKFLEMPISSRLLYYELGMRADDDGFVDNWKKILLFTGLKEDDLKVLISKQFILPFESGVIVIRHWRLNNYLQKDRTKPTIYQEELAQLDTDENNVYSLYTDCIHSIDKSSIDKSSIDKSSIDECSCNEKKDDFQKVIDFYNNNIGQLTPYGLTILESYTDQLEIDCIIYAMQKAVESNKRNIQYIKAILNNWVKAGIKTIVEAKDEEMEFKQRKEPKEETLEEQVARYKKEWGLTDED